MAHKPIKTGSATLIGGEIQVHDTNVTASSKIFLTNTGVGGTVGTLSVLGATASGFTINSANILDTSTISYMIIY